MAIDERNIVFDFGFTAVTAEELDAVQELDTKARTASAEAEELQRRLDTLYKSFLPLLTNLKKDADTKDYIYWKDRAPKIEEFESHLTNIYYGKDV
jgi:uncharacterized protein Yka (UPF0111/DUF47 family)